MNPLQRFEQGVEVYPYPDVPMTATEILRSRHAAMRRSAQVERPELVAFLEPIMARMRAILGPSVCRDLSLAGAACLDRQRGRQRVTDPSQS